ncbi:ABC transporter permease [Leuconostoc sp. MS02]|uniref:ABC transporter permease n=1 Tax=Leuconostoc aquikimchii TaxID=3236804 RepID=A0ABV3S532_9LACO
MIITPFLGELKKQLRNHQRNKIELISTLLWPILILSIMYGTYKSFNVNVLSNIGIQSQADLLLFLVTGALTYNFFWLSVQTAFLMVSERASGTLEIQFLSPANRYALMLGRALGTLIPEVWMFTIFSLFMITVSSRFNGPEFGHLIICFIILIFSSTIWGAFINSLFLISRDATFYFTLFDEPMRFLSGSQIPIQRFPIVFQVVGAIFPATHVLILIRQFLLTGDISGMHVLFFLISLIGTVLGTFLLIRIAERKQQKTGSFNNY